MTAAWREAVPEAAYLAFLVRTEDQSTVDAYLASIPPERAALLPLALAALVPVDTTVGDLLAWTDGPSHESTDDRVLRLHRSGWTDAAIAAEVGLHRSTVAYRRSRLGFGPTTKGLGVRRSA